MTPFAFGSGFRLASARAGGAGEGTGASDGDSTSSVVAAGFERSRPQFGQRRIPAETRVMQFRQFIPGRFGGTRRQLYRASGLKRIRCGWSASTPFRRL